MKTIIQTNNIIKVYHEKETIEVTIRNPDNLLDQNSYSKKIWLNYYSEETAKRDYNYVLICLKRINLQNNDELKTYV